MSNLTKAILTILLMVAVLIYTIFNYIRGSINSTYFIVFMAILCIPLVNMINILIQEQKKK